MLYHQPRNKYNYQIVSYGKIQLAHLHPFMHKIFLESWLFKMLLRYQIYRWSQVIDLTHFSIP